MFFCAVILGLGLGPFLVVKCKSNLSSTLLPIVVPYLGISACTLQALRSYSSPGIFMQLKFQLIDFQNNKLIIKDFGDKLLFI